MINDVTGILLAGGKSRRMGEDKRQLLLGQRSLFDRGLEVLRSLFSTVYVVLGQDSPPLAIETPVIRDLVPDCGTLGGLYTGLQQAATEHVFVAACDMPFLNPIVIRFMAGFRREADIVVARHNQKLQPTHALYGKHCLPELESMVQSHQVKIQGLVANPKLRVRLITESELNGIDQAWRSFLNINTPSDFEAVRRLVEDSPDLSRPR